MRTPHCGDYEVGVEHKPHCKMISHRGRYDITIHLRNSAPSPAPRWSLGKEGNRESSGHVESKELGHNYRVPVISLLWRTILNRKGSVREHAKRHPFSRLAIQLKNRPPPLFRTSVFFQESTQKLRRGGYGRIESTAWAFVAAQKPHRNHTEITQFPYSFTQFLCCSASTFRAGS